MKTFNVIVHVLTAIVLVVNGLVLFFPAVMTSFLSAIFEGNLSGIIMLVATAIALPLMFWATNYGEPFWSRFFWIPWMVGGLLCGIASIALNHKN